MADKSYCDGRVNFQFIDYKCEKCNKKVKNGYHCKGCNEGFHIKYGNYSNVTKWCYNCGDTSTPTGLRELRY